MIIREPDKAKQLVCFDGMRFEGRQGYAKVWPTDIDGYIQLDREKLFFLLELKYKGGMKYGQQSALTKLADAVGENCYVILAEHHSDLPEPIMVKDAVTTAVYRGTLGWLERPIGLNVKDTVETIVHARREVLNTWKT